MLKTLSMVGAMVIAGGLTGCTGSPVSPTRAGAPPQAVVLTGRALDWEIRDLAIERNGTLTSLLTWIYSNNVDLIVTEQSCGTRDFYGCRILGSSKSPRGTMAETVSVAVMKGQSIRFWIYNVDSDNTAAPYTLDIKVQ